MIRPLGQASPKISNIPQGGGVSRIFGAPRAFGEAPRARALHSDQAARALKVPFLSPCAISVSVTVFTSGERATSATKRSISEKSLMSFVWFSRLDEIVAVDGNMTEVRNQIWYGW